MGAFETTQGLVTTLVRAYAQRKTDLFRNHVEPLHAHVLKIHEDYLRGFAELRDHLRDRSVPPEQVVAFLRDRRREHAALRDLVKSLSSELASAKKRGFSDAVWQALGDYCNAVLDYFDASRGMAAVSWYSDFIQDVEANLAFRIELPEYPRHRNAWVASGIAGDPAADLLENAERTLDLYLPNALSAVNQTYARLRTMLV